MVFANGGEGTEREKAQRNCYRARENEGRNWRFAVSVAS